MSNLAAPSLTAVTAVTDAPPRPRAPLSRAERVGLGTLVAGSVGLGWYGVATHSPSTVSYLLTVWLLALLVARLRTDPLPAAMAVGLGVMGVAHLAGGIVTVGDDVLYNATFLTHAFEYDHPVHAFGVFLGTLAVWWFLLAGSAENGNRRGLIVVAVLGGLGLGAVNETVEFALTMAHHGGHVGGYANTGWDLTSNVVGGLLAGAVIARQPRWIGC